MKLDVSTIAATHYECPLIGIPVSEFKNALPRYLAPYDVIVGGQLTAAAVDFEGKTGQSQLFYDAGGGRRFLFVGTGAGRASVPDTVRRAAGRVGATAQKLKLSRAAFVLPEGGDALSAAQAAAEGVRLGSYVFNRYQTIDPRPNTLKEAVVLVPSSSRRTAEKGVKIGTATGWGTLIARDMVNTPACDWTPASFAEAANALGIECGFDVHVKGPAELKKEGFGGLLAVGGGSANPPRFVRMDYRKGKGKPVILVGKGITFDTGGISLKPGQDMDQMKADMAGAAVVLATVAVVARLGLPVNVTGLICTAENMPSGTAYRPGDVVRVYGGKTIEVLNTDAEGRVVLADGLSYATTLDPRFVIDMATLTGAIIIALGHHTAGVMGSDQKLVNALLRAGRQSGEKLWHMPLDEEHTQLVKSDIADVKNTAGRPAASCTAAAFLKTFTNDLPWAHLDIAGVDLEFKGTDYVPKGPSGFGVRLLVDFLSRL